MHTVLPAEWPADPDRAAALQHELAALVRLEPLARAPALIGGVAAAPADPPSPAGAAAVVLDAQNAVLETVLASARAPSPYRPGELAFAVGPACLTALAELDVQPDLLLVLGHGIAHPRRCGLASHLGVLLDIPVIGCADRPLVGQAQEPSLQAGSHAALLADGDQLGAVMRTRDAGRPIVISPGHRVTCDQAAQLALSQCRGHRWPEPIRLARLELRRWRQAGADE